MTSKNESKSCDDPSARETRLVDAAWEQVGPERPSSGMGAAASRTAPPSDAGPLLRIRGYRILTEMHRGGQGVVYAAMQESTRRKVAIKVLRHGPLADESERARFDREVDLLSRLRHPNIVAIHDRGRAGGHAFYVMDFVPGKSLDAHVASGEVEVDQMLRLFQRICDAVGAAHVRGIIHRDLKPANIRIDEDGEPRVLDFGLAKMAEPERDVHHGVTITGQFIGSLPWASPEQAEGRADDVDVRTDVYSLGVILYQLLTGSFPYAVCGETREVVANIVGAAPVAPSALRRTIGNELETIVLRCLAKERERRYQSAGELSRDIARLLDGEPIEAKRDSGWYVFHKAVRRHQVALGAAAVFALLLTAAGGTGWILLSQAREARRTADEHQRMAEGEARRAWETQRVLDSILRLADPWVAAGADTTILRNVLDGAGAVVERERDRQPLFCAGIQETIGRTYTRLDQFDRAETHLLSSLAIRERLLGRRSVAAGSTIQAMASLRLGQRRLEEAERLAIEALEILEQTAGPDSVEVSASTRVLAEVKSQGADREGAVLLFRDAIRLYKDAGVVPGTLVVTYCELGSTLRSVGRTDDALTAYAEALAITERELRADDPARAVVHERLGALESERYELTPAEDHLRRALAIYRACFPGAHIRTAQALTALGTVLNRAERYADAEPLFVEALEMYRELPGQPPGARATALIGLGMARKNLGRLDDAESEYHEALPLVRAGHDERSEAVILNNLAALCKAQGRIAESEPLDQQALAIRRRLFGEDHLDVAQSLYNLGDTAEAIGDNHRAIESYREALGIQQRAGGRHCVLAGRTLVRLGRCLALSGDPSAAEADLAEAISILAVKGAHDESRVFVARMSRAGALVQLDCFADAECELLECQRHAEADGSPMGAERRVAELFVMLYDRWQRPDEAARWRARLRE